jgi:hypothetical protein
MTQSRSSIGKYFLVVSKLLVVLGSIATFVWPSITLADEAIPVSEASVVSISKTTAPELPTSKSMMITELAESAETPPDLLPTLCLNVDLGRHHLSMDDEVVLTGLMKGRNVFVKVGTYGPEHEGNHCGGNSTMVTTDLSNMDFMKNDLYTGSLNITISTE